LKSTLESLDISYILHETEDMEKVNSVVSLLVGAETSPGVEMLTGHFGNSIKRVSFHLHGDDATKSFARLVERLPQALKGELVKNIDRSLDEHSSLFLRFDKQRLIRGEFAVGTSDVVRLKVKAGAFMMKGRASDFFISLLEGR
jgi:RNA binding exosome subunit